MLEKRSTHTQKKVEKTFNIQYPLDVIANFLNEVFFFRSLFIYTHQTYISRRNASLRRTTHTHTQGAKIDLINYFITIVDERLLSYYDVGR